MIGALEMKHLRMICAIADTGTITRAAQRLSISQSALSQQLKDIEDKLSTDLFYRTPRKMLPTPVGQQLLGTARTVLDAVQRAEAKVAHTVHGAAGTLKVGTQCIFCYQWLPHVLKAFQSQFPGVDVEIGNAGDPGSELMAGTFDLVITAIPHKAEHLAGTRLFSDQLVCLLPPQHPLCSASFIRLEDFSGCKLISHATRSRNRFYQNLLKPKGIEPERIMTVSPPHAIIAMVAAGIGMTVVPRWAVSPAVVPQDVCARPITRSGVPLTWHAVSLKSTARPSFHAAFERIVAALDAKAIRSLPQHHVAA